ncbi:MAG: MFS transporter [Ahrensia sp.]|nr:MFS transporter [Ahrensia sp.]
MKARSILLLIVAQMAALSLWFVSAAILPDMLAQADISPFRQAALSSAVQVGFVVGALASAVTGLSDRIDPRFVFAACAFVAACANALLTLVEPGGILAISLRFVTGAMLAGVYPVGMKIAVGWGTKDRGFLVSALIGALTFGSALPHLIALGGGADWRATVLITSAASVLAAVLVLGTRLGPHHAKAALFNMRVVTTAWTNRRVRLAYAGYLGHMWELYAMWAWVGVAAAASYRLRAADPVAQTLGSITAFSAIAAGAVTCLIAGKLADRYGKAEVAAAAMACSLIAAVATGLSFGGPIWITFALFVIWGIAIIPDSAQFSALVADASPPEHAGSLMTFQTALGFTLTFFTVQVTPLAAQALSWPAVFYILAIGPALGIVAMMRLRHLGR